MDSMLKPYRNLVTYPVQAVFTGRVDGMEVSRNPLHWLPLWIAVLVIPPILLILYPVYVMIALIGGWLFLRQGNDARITEAGIEVFSKRKGLIARHDWRDIRSASLLFDPPGTYPQITLASGGIVPLHLAGFDEIASACEARGIAVDRTRKFADPGE